MNDAGTPWLIPVRRFKRSGGCFRLGSPLVLASAQAADQLPLHQVAQALASLGVRARVVRRSPLGSDALGVRRSVRAQHAEGYRLVIGSDHISISSATDAGVYYAAQALIELLRCYGTALPAGRIDDYPDFSRRAVYFDCARGRIPKLETLKALVERLAHWRFNELQLYVENGFAFAGHPELGRGFSPLAPEDIHELQAFARLHHIRLVGSLASFGHMEMMLRHSAYMDMGELPGYRGWPGGSTLCPVDRRSIRFVRELYNEFVPLFDAVDFNACGDEPWELGQGRSRQVVERKGKGRVYLEFMKQVYRICESHGKRTNLWADIVLQHPEVLTAWPKDIVMLNWGYDADAANIKRCRDIAEAGHAFMVCSGTNGWGTHGTRLRRAFGNVANFAKEGRRYHAEGLLHTDWGDGCHRNTLAVSLCSMAHAGAHAWHGRAVNDAAFPELFCRQWLEPRAAKQMATQLETIGSITENVGTYNGIYFSFGTAILPSRRKRLERVDHIGLPQDRTFPQFDEDRLQEAMAQLAPLIDESAWPKLGRAAFDRQTRSSYALAARQDWVCCRRIMLGNRYQRGQTVAAAEWRQLAHQIAQLEDEFCRLWLAAHRPSRLNENQHVFKLLRNEALRLASG